MLAEAALVDEGLSAAFATEGGHWGRLEVPYVIHIFGGIVHTHRTLNIICTQMTTTTDSFVS